MSARKPKPAKPASPHYTFAPHIPHASGDAEWHVLRDGKVVAVVDPHMTMDDSSRAEVAALFVHAHAMADVLRMFRDWSDKDGNDDMLDAALGAAREELGKLERDNA